jgi:GH25 family lysozyme M1 (1,4-beta-N-acetylmuramidase)
MALSGIDVSVFQGAVNWDQASVGNAFAIAKATEGVGFADPQFARNWAELSRVGLVRGAYHFGRPDLGNTPQSEADWFLSVVQPGPGDILELDLEVGTGDLSTWALGFLDHVRDRLGGYRPLFYSFLDFLRTRGLFVPRMSDYGLWLAWPDSNGPLPPVAPWPMVAFQQYGQGAQPGIQGDVDLDRFFGDRAALRRYSIGGGFKLDYSLKLALVGLMYFAVLGRGPGTQPEADQWAQQIGDQGQNAWEVLQTIAASPEAQAYATPAARIKALETAVKNLQISPVGRHTHPISLTGSSGQPV